jgi:RNA polymerase sigma-70 factor, ECF subfamily
MRSYQSQCSLRTWVYRVAHNVGVNHVQKSRREAESKWISLEDLEDHVDDTAHFDAVDRRLDLERLMHLIHSLAAHDRFVMILYLEDMDAATIAEVTGFSARNVATKIHRIKKVLAKQMAGEGKPL